jgi:hypothetical protein
MYLLNVSSIFLKKNSVLELSNRIVYVGANNIKHNL